MPLYEYRCGKCGQDVTVIQSMADLAPQQCPLCGGGKLTRLFSPFSVVKSGKDRTRDLSWIDRDVSRRLRKKAGGKLSPEFRTTLDRLGSG